MIRLFLVDCNDTLYGHDRKYLAEVDKMADTLLEEILNQLKLLDKPEVEGTDHMYSGGDRSHAP